MRNSSPEGVLRLVHELGQGQIGNIGTNGIEFKIAESEDWLGARVLLKTTKSGKSRVDLIPQVGARTSSAGEWTWYLEKDINADFAAKYPTGSEFRVIGSGTSYAKTLNRLKRVCPKYHHKGELSTPVGKDGKVGVNLEHEFTAVVRRCLAKIAFNYLAYVRGGEFVQKAEFDSIRSFIRYGAESSAVLVGQRPILADEIVAGGPVTDGHIVTVEGLPDERRVDARLTLFNSLKYRIILTCEYSGIWFAKGHHFHLKTRECTELHQTHVVQAVTFG